MSVNAVFPYWEIEYGCALALYGCGKNGLLCYRALKESNYCHVVCCVDQNYAGKALDDRKAEPIEALRNAKYDRILITIENQDIAAQVRSMLVEMGIPQGKILTVWDQPVPLTMEQLENSDYMQTYLRCGYEQRKVLTKITNEYYLELYMALFLYKADMSLLLDIFKKLLFQMEDDESKIILLYLMYENNYFDADCLQMLMKCLLYAVWRDDTCYDMVIDTSWMIHKCPAYLYDEFFTDRINLQKKVCEYYELYQLGNVIKRDKRRIAIVMSSLQSPKEGRHGGALSVLNYTRELVKRGYEVKVVAVWVGAASDPRKKFLKKWDWVQPEQCIKMKQEFEEFGVPFEIHYDADIRTRLHRNVQSVVDWQPSFILDMGDEFFPEAYALIQWFPVIQLPLRSNDYSSAATLRIFGNRETVRKDNLVYRAVSDESVREVLLGNLDRWEDDSLPFVREKCGFCSEDFLLVTVSGALDLYIDADMLEAVCRMLKKYANMKWILVGNMYELENALMKRAAAEEQIIFWGYEENLESLYGMCDVCLNLPRRGGGISLRLAMKAGLPVATTDYPSGILNYMDSEQVVHGDCEALMAYVERLYQNPELYRQVSEECRRRIAKFSLASDVDKILAVCQEANQLFEQTHRESVLNDTF